MCKSIAIILLMAGAATMLAGAQSHGVVEQLSPDAIQLELPELGSHRYGPGVLRIPEPENIRHLVLHIPLHSVHQVFPKINTIGTGLVQTLRERQDEMVCDIDLSRNQARYYSFTSADNTVEIKVVPRRGAEPIYARWVIAPPKEPQAWKVEESLAGGSRGGAGAGAELSGLAVLAEQEDGRLAPLDKGITTSSRVFLQARFLHQEESVSLRIHWVGEQGAERAFSAGSWNVAASGRKAAGGSTAPALEGEVDLDRGENRVEVEVLHGYVVLARSTFRIYRRAPLSPVAVQGDKWAVVIGISDYQEPGHNLRYADRDATAVRDLLVDKGGFHPDRVRLLTDQQATYQAIRTALFDFLSAAQPDDLVVIFLAGHGVQDDSHPDNFYFLAHDSTLRNLGGTGVPMWDLRNAMDYSIRARRIVVFADTCHSGAAAQGTGPGTRAQFNFFNKYLEVLAQQKGRLILTASQSHENALESPSLEHGVFTQVLLAGLGGAADDNPTDGVVTLGELIDYVRTKVPEQTHGEQHPSYSDQAFDLGLPLAYVRRAPAPARRTLAGP